MRSPGVAEVCGLRARLTCVPSVHPNGKLSLCPRPQPARPGLSAWQWPKDVAKYQITFHTGTLYSQRLANTELRFGRNVSVVLNWIFVSQVERERECWILQVRKDELSVAPTY